MTGRYYYVTKYTQLDKGKFIADEKRLATEEEIKDFNTKRD